MPKSLPCAVLCAGDFFSDPGAAGLTCAKSGPVKIAADLKANKDRPVAHAHAVFKPAGMFF